MNQGSAKVKPTSSVDLMEDGVEGQMEYAAEKLERSRPPVYGPFMEGEDIPPPPGNSRKTFKYVDGVERLSDMELPFLVDLPNGSSEAVFVVAAKNAGCGVVPILE